MTVDKFSKIYQYLEKQKNKNRSHDFTKGTRHLRGCCECKIIEIMEKAQAILNEEEYAELWVKNAEELKEHENHKIILTGGKRWTLDFHKSDLGEGEKTMSLRCHDCDISFINATFEKK